MNIEKLEEQFKKQYKLDDGDPKAAFIEFLKETIKERKNERKDIKDMTALETLKDIPNRFVSLIWNLVSRWGLVFDATIVLLVLGVFKNWYTVVAWIVFSILFLFKTEGPEIITKILQAGKQSTPTLPDA